MIRLHSLIPGLAINYHSGGYFMNLTFNTQNVNIQVALKALNAYRAGDFMQAASALQEILDMEPQNWDARLMLGACHFKTGHYFQAECAFRNICENCKDTEIRNKARQGMLSAGSKITNRVNIPDIGSCVVRQDIPMGWMD